MLCCSCIAVMFVDLFQVKECVRANKVLSLRCQKRESRKSSASYNMVIDGFARLGNFESAKKVLERMESDEYTRPCSAAYFSLIRNMVREGEINSALEVGNCEEKVGYSVCDQRPGRWIGQKGKSKGGKRCQRNNKKEA
ncbi:hypothetical protein MLD38_019028 [Melastoma candidum]|uniref:Uncharacterized protein n=1 Tax=Melastoma candidum TaxID=119954 RepID=A0ACB9QVL6_9MYRT|nr:hypothetical protein MLD38_019028 [Melastoma candidum]